MATRLLYLILLFLSLSMLLFVAGFLCFHLGLTVLTTLLYSLAGKIMLMTFAGILLSGILALLAALRGEFRAYFQADAGALRRILAIYNRKHNLTLRQNLEIRQIHYFHNQKRQRLLSADNQKQLRELHKTILQELESAKPRLPSSHFAELRKALRQHLDQADAQAMLVVRQQITCL
jgi:hypothetical protein